MLHKTGNKYKTKDGLIGLLSTFQKGEDSYCVLITLADSADIDYEGFRGNRYCDPIKVNNPYNVSENEMLQIVNNQPYELYTSPITF